VAADEAGASSDEQMGQGERALGERSIA